MRLRFLSLTAVLVAVVSAKTQGAPPTPDPTTDDVIIVQTPPPPRTPDPTTDNPPTPEPTMDDRTEGAYFPIGLSKELRQMLYSTLANVKSYDDSVTARICVRKPLSAKNQLVGGVNYAFAVKGCDVHDSLVREHHHEPKSSTIIKHVGQCSKGIKANCVKVQATVVVYESWDDPDLEVKPTSIWSIEPLNVADTKTTMHVRVHEDEDEDDDD